MLHYADATIFADPQTVAVFVLQAGHTGMWRRKLFDQRRRQDLFSFNLAAVHKSDDEPRQVVDARKNLTSGPSPRVVSKRANHCRFVALGNVVPLRTWTGHRHRRA